MGSPQDTLLKQECAARLEERNWAGVSRKKVSGSLIDQKRENPVFQNKIIKMLKYKHKDFSFTFTESKLITSIVTVTLAYLNKADITRPVSVCSIFI